MIMSRNQRHAYLARSAERRERSEALIEWCRKNHIREIARKLCEEARKAQEEARKAQEAADRVITQDNE